MLTAEASLKEELLEKKDILRESPLLKLLEANFKSDLGFSELRENWDGTKVEIRSSGGTYIGTLVFKNEYGDKPVSVRYYGFILPGCSCYIGDYRIQSVEAFSNVTVNPSTVEVAPILRCEWVGQDSLGDLAGRLMSGVLKKGNRDFHPSVNRKNFHAIIGQVGVISTDWEGGRWIINGKYDIEDRKLEFPFLDLGQLITKYVKDGKSIDTDGFMFKARCTGDSDYGFALAHKELYDAYCHPIIAFSFKIGPDYIRQVQHQGMTLAELKEFGDKGRKVGGNFLNFVDISSLAIDLMTQIANYVGVPRIEVLPAEQNKHWDPHHKDWGPERLKKHQDTMRGHYNLAAEAQDFSKPTAKNPMYHKILVQ